MNLRVLHPQGDESLYREAWRWRESYPRLVRKWDYLKHFRQWFALMKRRVTVGVFTDHLIALVTFRPDGDDIYEVHVDCVRRVDQWVLLTGLLSIRKTVFEEWGAREVFAGIVSRNYGIISIAEACGFTRDGISDQVGDTKWIRLRITNVQYQNEHNYFQPTKPIRKDARRRFARHSKAA